MRIHALMNPFPAPGNRHVRRGCNGKIDFRCNTHEQQPTYHCARQDVNRAMAHPVARTGGHTATQHHIHARTFLHALGRMPELQSAAFVCTPLGDAGDRKCVFVPGRNSYEASDE